VHFKRELGKKVSYKVERELMAATRTVFAGESVAECLHRGEELAAAWENGTNLATPDGISVRPTNHTYKRRERSVNCIWRRRFLLG
jgi:hypothetical protein